MTSINMAHCLLVYGSPIVSLAHWLGGQLILSGLRVAQPVSVVNVAAEFLEGLVIYPQIVLVREPQFECESLAFPVFDVHIDSLLHWLIGSWVKKDA